MANEFQSIQRMFPKDNFMRERTRVTLHTILSMLPSRSVAELPVSLFIARFPKVYQVLDVATFSKQCERFWNPDETGNSAFSAEFAPLLAMVVALGSQFHHSSEEEPYQDLRRMSDAVDGWLAGLNYEKKMQPITLQTSCLLVISMRMLFMPTVQVWQCTGDLVRSALTIGLHRDPNEIDSKMSVVQANLRRRLWYIIANLDVEASILCCMPSLVHAIPYTCGIPAEYPPDSNATESAVLNGTVANLNTMDIACQQLMAEALPIRLRALQILTKTPPNASEVRMTLKDLESQRASLLMKFRSSHPRTASDAVCVYNEMMLDMCLRRPMISLNTLGIQCQGYLETNDGVLQALSLSMTVMSASEAFESEQSDDHIGINERLWSTFQALNCDDIIRAAYSACFCLQTLGNMAFKIGPVHPLGLFELNIPRSTVRRTVDDFIKTYISKKSDLGLVLKHLMALAIASESTKPAKDYAAKQDPMRTCLDRILQLVRERHAADERRDSHASYRSEHGETSSSPSRLGFDEFIWQEFDFDPSSFNWDLGLFADVQIPD